MIIHTYNLSLSLSIYVIYIYVIYFILDIVNTCTLCIGNYGFVYLFTPQRGKMMCCLLYIQKLYNLRYEYKLQKSKMLQHMEKFKNYIAAT